MWGYYYHVPRAFSCAATVLLCFVVGNQMVLNNARASSFWAVAQEISHVADISIDSVQEKDLLVGAHHPKPKKLAEEDDDPTEEPSSHSCTAVQNQEEKFQQENTIGENNGVVDEEVKEEHQRKDPAAEGQIWEAFQLLEEKSQSERNIFGVGDDEAGDGDATNSVDERGNLNNLHQRKAGTVDASELLEEGSQSNQLDGMEHAEEEKSQTLDLQNKNGNFLQSDQNHHHKDSNQEVHSSVESSALEEAATRASIESPPYQTAGNQEGQQSWESTERQQTARGSDDAIPVIMIPSFAGTRLRNWADVNCEGRGPILPNFRVGGSVWLDIKRLLTQTTCWIRCLSLIPETQQDDLCVTRPDEGIDAIYQVDEQLPTGFLWKGAIDMLASDLGYQPSRNMIAHPYDWRLPPKKMEERDRSFSRLKLKIERIVLEYKQRNPHTPHRGVFLVAFSLGNLYVQYFFQYLEYELGRKNMERWVDEHIYALVMAGAPLLGSQSIVDSILGGETVGLPMTKEQSRDMFLTWGSMPWMMPFVPKIPNKRHLAMNHEEADFPVRAVQVTTKDGRILRPKNTEIVKKNGWWGKTGDERLAKVQRIIDTWYGADPLFGGGETLREPWKPPEGIDHTICAYGVNVETPVRTEYEEDIYRPGHWRKTDEIVNQRGDVFSTKDGRRVLPARQRLAQRKSGDGSVPYFSLSWCHSWFGNDVVNVTKVPAHRKYEQDEIERFQNIDVLDTTQKQQLEKRPHGFNTFFTQQWVDIQPDTGLQRPKSIQVMEFDGITHRDSVTHPLFLRIWKDFLMGTLAFSRTYEEKKERVIRKLWNEMAEAGMLDSINSWLGEISIEGAFLSSSGDSPPSDDDCRWDYAMVRCARPRYCEYRYRVGDVHLSQSCRLREKPLAKDDPSLLLQDAEAYNVSYNVAPDRVEWQTVYRPQDPGIIQPWAQLMFAFLGGAVALAFLLYFALRAHGFDRWFPRRHERMD